MPIETKADLEQLIRDSVPESLTLDYKRSDVLSKDNRKRDELCKDVSAFANSAGGQLIYGISENDQVPQSLDSGVDKTVITPEWIEQVLASRIQPRIAGVRIKQISAESGDNQVYYVIDVPQATTFAPHQAPDNKYYKRHNFTSDAMEDYEVRDALRRATTPALRLEFQFGDGSQEQLVRLPTGPEPEIGQGPQVCDTMTLSLTIHNDSPQPAEYVYAEIYVHPALILQRHDGFTVDQRLLTEPVPRRMNVLSRQFAVPQDIPLFKEVPRRLSEAIYFAVQVHSVLRDMPNAGSSGYPFPVGYRLRAPGFDEERWGTLNLRNDRLYIEFER